MEKLEKLIIKLNKKKELKKIKSSKKEEIVKNKYTKEQIDKILFKIRKTCNQLKP